MSDAGAGTAAVHVEVEVEVGLPLAAAAPVATPTESAPNSPLVRLAEPPAHQAAPPLARAAPPASAANSGSSPAAVSAASEPGPSGSAVEAAVGSLGAVERIARRRAERRQRLEQRRAAEEEGRPKEPRGHPLLAVLWLSGLRSAKAAPCCRRAARDQREAALTTARPWRFRRFPPGPDGHAFVAPADLTGAVRVVQVLQRVLLYLPLNTHSVVAAAGVSHGWRRLAAHLPHWAYLLPLRPHIGLVVPALRPDVAPRPSGPPPAAYIPGGPSRAGVGIDAVVVAARAAAVRCSQAAFHEASRRHPLPEVGGGEEERAAAAVHEALLCLHCGALRLRQKETAPREGQGFSDGPSVHSAQEAPRTVPHHTELLQVTVPRVVRWARRRHELLCAELGLRVATGSPGEAAAIAVPQESQPSPGGGCPCRVDRALLSVSDSESDGDEDGMTGAEAIAAARALGLLPPRAAIAEAFTAHQRPSAEPEVEEGAGVSSPTRESPALPGADAEPCPVPVAALLPVAESDDCASEDAPTPPQPPPLSPPVFACSASLLGSFALPPQVEPEAAFVPPLLPPPDAFGDPCIGGESLYSQREDFGSLRAPPALIGVSANTAASEPFDLSFPPAMPAGLAAAALAPTAAPIPALTAPGPAPTGSSDSGSDDGGVDTAAAAEERIERWAGSAAVARLRPLRRDGDKSVVGAAGAGAEAEAAEYHAALAPAIAAAARGLELFAASAGLDAGGWALTSDALADEPLPGHGAALHGGRSAEADLVFLLRSAVASGAVLRRAQGVDAGGRQAVLSRHAFAAVKGWHRMARGWHAPALGPGLVLPPLPHGVALAPSPLGAAVAAATAEEGTDDVAALVPRPFVAEHGADVAAGGACVGWRRRMQHRTLGAFTAAVEAEVGKAAEVRRQDARVGWAVVAAVYAANAVLLAAQWALATMEIVSGVLATDSGRAAVAVFFLLIVVLVTVVLLPASWLVFLHHLFRRRPLALFERLVALSLCCAVAGAVTVLPVSLYGNRIVATELLQERGAVSVCALHRTTWSAHDTRPLEERHLPAGFLRSDRAHRAEGSARSGFGPAWVRFPPGTTLEYLVPTGAELNFTVPYVVRSPQKDAVVPRSTLTENQLGTAVFSRIAFYRVAFPAAAPRPQDVLSDDALAWADASAAKQAAATAAAASECSPPPSNITAITVAVSGDIAGCPFWAAGGSVVDGAAEFFSPTLRRAATADVAGAGIVLAQPSSAASVCGVARVATVRTVYTVVPEGEAALRQVPDGSAGATILAPPLYLRPPLRRDYYSNDHDDVQGSWYTGTEWTARGVPLLLGATDPMAAAAPSAELGTERRTTAGARRYTAALGAFPAGPFPTPLPTPFAFPAAAATASSRDTFAEACPLSGGNTSAAAAAATQCLQPLYAPSLGTATPAWTGALGDELRAVRRSLLLGAGAVVLLQALLSLLPYRALAHAALVLWAGVVVTALSGLPLGAFGLWCVASLPWATSAMAPVECLGTAGSVVGIATFGLVMCALFCATAAWRYCCH